MRRLAWLVSAIAVTTLACGSDLTGFQAAHAAAIRYLDSAITIMQNIGFYRRRVNRDSVRAAARQQAAASIRSTATS